MNIWTTSISQLLLIVSAVCSVLISSGIKGKKCDIMWVRWRNIGRKSLSFSPSWEPHTPFSSWGTCTSYQPTQELTFSLSFLFDCKRFVSCFPLEIGFWISFGFQFSLQYLSQPISWGLDSPKPSEHSLPHSRGFSVAVMRCVHKAAALPHSPLPLMEPKEP